MQNSPLQTSEDLRIVLENAKQEAARRHAPYTDVEHLLLALFKRQSNPVQALFTQHEVNPQQLYDQVAETVGVERDEPIEVRDFTRQAKAALEHAAAEAQRLNHAPVNSGHLLLGLMELAEGPTHEILSGLPFTADDVRTHLKNEKPGRFAIGTGKRSQPPGSEAAPSSRLTRPLAPRSTRQRPPSPAAKRKRSSGDDGEFVLVPTRAKPKRKRSGEPSILDRIAGSRLALLLIGALLAYFVLAQSGTGVAIFVIVLAGWIFSVTLHEFAHALVAYLGGDYTVRDKGYLTFNPLKYTHPMLSIGLPLLFLALGGIGLPGGAVYIERHRLRNKWWGAAVSAAGPAANLLLAIVLSLPFIFGWVDVPTIFNKIRWEGLNWGAPESSIWNNVTLWRSVAVLIALQVTAVLFNLLPVPPLDGFGIIEPLLDERTRWQLRQIGAFSLLILFFILWTPAGDGFWDMIYQFTDWLRVPELLISDGFYYFMFWRQ